MMITSVKTHLLSAPFELADAPEWSAGALDRQAAALIEITTDEGVTGFGEAYVGVFAPRAVVGAVAEYVPLLVGRDPLRTERRVHELRVGHRWWADVGLGRSVAAAIENALIDLKGKALGLPAWQLLGGLSHDKLEVYGSTAGSLSLEKIVADARRVVDDGYTCIKIPIGFDAETDYRILSEVREEVGPGVRVAADAVQGYAPTPWSGKEALRVARRLEPLGLEWLEEPVAARDAAGNAQVRAGTSIPIAGGESLTCLEEFNGMIECGAFDILQPDASHIGMFETKAVIRTAEARGLRTVLHAWGSGPALMANYHTAFASPTCSMVEFPTSTNPLISELLREPLDFVDGFLRPPTLPGLGIEVTPEILDKFPFSDSSGYVTKALDPL